MNSNIPESICCPLTHAPMSHPVVDHEGHSYEKKAIMKWLKKKNVSPITGAPLFPCNLKDNFKLRDTIQTTMEALGLVFDDDPEALADKDEECHNLHLNISKLSDEILLSVVPLLIDV